MKIALYYPWIYLTSGVERTILETLKKSKHKITVFTNRYEKENTFPEFKKLKVIELTKIPVRRNLLSVLKAALIIIFQKIDLSTFDLLLVHSGGLGDFVLFRNSEIPAICYCHTPLRPVFDEEYKKRVFKTKNSFQKFLYYFFAFAFKLSDKLMWRRYKHVFFNSKESLRRALIGGLVSSGNKNYSVLNPGIDIKKIKPSGVYKPYFFLPGRIMWTKNIEFAVESFREFKKNGKFHEFKLIIAGRVDEKSRQYLKTLNKLAGKNSDIKFIINPSDKVMNRLYAESTAVLSTAFNEDWGLTLLEGNAHAKATTCVNRGGPRESQLKGKTGFLLEADKKAFSEAFGKLASNKNLVKRMGRNARKNALKYDWNNYIEKMDELISRLG